MPRYRRPIMAAFLAGALASATAVARAGEPTAADVESALALYKDGKALREKGDLAGALEKLRAAHALVETPITALELGKAYAAAKKYVEAREVLLAVARIPVRKNESQKGADARVEAEALAQEVKPKLATLTVRVQPASARPPALAVDGVEIPAAAAAAPRVVNPGAHTLTASLDGRTAKGEVSLGEGESREVTLDLPAEGPAVPVQGDVRKRTSPLVYVGFGTAIVGVAVGTVTGVMTLSSTSDIKGRCQGDRCPPAVQGDIDSSKTTGWISTIAFGVAAAGVAVGVIGLVVGGGEAKPTARVRPWIGAGEAGVRGEF
jgi:hypothetical protein